MILAGPGALLTGVRRPNPTFL